tara:strand:+ start:18826 stop:19230 length:405 start_codon:yes stop_codon:yes gene_type:complete
MNAEVTATLLSKTYKCVVSNEDYFQTNFGFLGLNSPPPNLIVISVAEELHSAIIKGRANSSWVSVLQAIVSVRSFLVKYISNTKIDNDELPFYIAVATAYVDLFARLFNVNYGMSANHFEILVENFKNNVDSAF